MNKLIFVLVAAAALVGTGIYMIHQHKKHHEILGASNIPTPVYDAWVHWKNTHKKLYLNKFEEAKRLQVFYENWKKVAQHQQKNDRTYEMGFTKFMDLSAAEFKAMYLNLKVQEAPKNYVKLPEVNLPSSVDWRQKGAVNPVKDQGQCGSCWAFSTVGALEGLHFLKTGQLASFSEQQLVDCSGDYGNEGCNGGLMDQAFQYVEKAGIALESNYDYTAQDGQCKSPLPEPLWHITGYNDVTVGSDTQLQAAAAQQTVSVAVDAESWQFYTGGVFSDCSDSLDHGVTLVGYVQGSYWLVRNSWGTSWGENGYIRLKWGNTCGIENAASYPTA